MSEANKSLMLSEAEIIEAINSDSLISVSLGAGQPQKNVKMSTLATVAAGLMGLNLHKQQISVLPKETKTLTAYRGLALMYTDINHGNAVVSINGQLDQKISVIHNGTSGGIMFDDTGGFLNISNKQPGIISIYNNNPQHACNFYMMVLDY